MILPDEPTVVDALHLEIEDYSCACGNKWTHSHAWLASQLHGYLGGTPDPMQMEKLQFQSFSNSHRNVNGCHRCVPLQLGKNWTRPLIPSYQPVGQNTLAQPKAKTKAELAREDLLA